MLEEWSIYFKPTCRGAGINPPQAEITLAKHFNLSPDNDQKKKAL